jgi:beta-lactamase superfamily II metal-dependent hydrolase
MPARKGDCLMLHYGSQDEPRLMMIDGGPSNVYRPHLRPRIEQIRKSRHLDEEHPLDVEVLLVSHVDDDHIKGILELTAELRAIKQERGHSFLRVKSLWHNSFDDLLTTTPDELKRAAGFGAAALSGTIDLADEEEFDAAKILASIPQGRDLRLDAEFLKWKPNHKFSGKLILATAKEKTANLDGGLKLTVIGPMQPELEALQKKHDEWLRQRKRKKASADAALAAFVDKSIHNLSSIVLLAEVEGKTMLLTGDARGDKIMEGLRLAGLLSKGGQGGLHVDILKVPHHGSANNMETSFFRRITADHYVFSGNGEHGNPERETLEMLLEARGNERYTVHLTYPVDEIDVERKKDWQKQQAKEKSRMSKPVRENWSAKKHSLAGLFDAHPKFAKKVRIVKHGKPYLIHLLEEF